MPEHKEAHVETQVTNPDAPGSLLAWAGKRARRGRVREKTVASG
jgi:hypothetical protein